VAREYTERQSGFFASMKEFFGLLCIVVVIRVFLFGLYQVPTGSMETTMLVGERFFADKLSYFFRKPVRGEIISLNAPGFVYSTNPVMKILQLYLLGPYPFALGPDNWTKRVIGVPGDYVEGKVEDGIPVVYLNGKKLDEPYLNKYPLLQVWLQDPQVLFDSVKKEIQEKFGRTGVDQATLEKFVAQKLDCRLRSYDPSVGYDEQPFYRIDPKRIVSPELTLPQTPIRSDGIDIQVREGENFWNGSDRFSVHLGADEYWCMGDNRLGSSDCRSFGPFKEEWIRGRILFRIWSMNSTESWWIVDLIKNPIDFWQRIRWSRFFQMVH
jgi:signal peptidase I